MANRFLDSNYFKSPFVRALKGPLKSLYSFIICDCDGAGIWNMDLQAASMYIGFDVSQEEFESNFTEKGKAINLGGNKFFFPDFIEHQYPAGLQANNKAHKNFIATLKKFDLLDENLNITVDKKQRGLEASSKASHVMYRSSNGNGIGQGNGKPEELHEEPECDTTWHTKPGTDFLEMDLDDVKAGAVKQLFLITKNHHLKNDELKGLWSVFKSQNFTGEKYYASKNAVFSHFINWSKTQNINGTHKQPVAANGARVTKSSGAEKLVSKFKDKLSSYTGGAESS